MVPKTSPESGKETGRTTFVMLIWRETQPVAAPLWRGMLETASGTRRYFGSLAQLARLMAELGGWVDAPETSTGHDDD